MAVLTVTVILVPKKIKSDTASTFSPSVCHEVMELDSLILAKGLRSNDLSFINVEF